MEPSPVSVIMLQIFLCSVHMLDKQPKTHLSINVVTVTLFLVLKSLYDIKNKASVLYLLNFNLLYNNTVCFCTDIYL